MVLTVDESGLIPGIRLIASPNCDERPPGCAIELVVIHNISLPPGEFGGPGIVELFTGKLNPDAHPYYRELAELRVSAHFVIRRSGEIIQFVACGSRAWHAGVSSWRGKSHCNDFSLGVELEGADEIPFEDRQYTQLAALTRALQAQYPITAIAGHSDVAPGRKTDPGPCFDWVRYRSMI